MTRAALPGRSLRRAAAWCSRTCTAWRPGPWTGARRAGARLQEGAAMEDLPRRAWECGRRRKPGFRTPEIQNATGSACGTRSGTVLLDHDREFLRAWRGGGCTSTSTKRLMGSSRKSAASTRGVLRQPQHPPTGHGAPSSVVGVGEDFGVTSAAWCDTLVGLDRATSPVDRASG
jgi:hypothetical protein